MTHQRSASALVHRITLTLLAASVLVVAGPAHADGDDRRDSDNSKTHIAVDFDFDNALNEPGTEAGGGGAIRVGQEFDLFLVSLTPEVGGSYHAFGGEADNRIYAGFLGGRLGIGKVIEPSIFAHLGVARVVGLESRTAPLFDVGLALDFTLLPLLDLGVHGAYNAMLPRDNSSSFSWITLGVHAALVF